MSEHSTPEERTELPTDRRMGQLRREGQLPLSTDIVQVASLIGGFLIAQQCWSWLVHVQKQLMVRTYGMIQDPAALDIPGLYNLIFLILKDFGPPVLVITVCVATISSLSVMLQTNWNIKQKLIDIKWNYLDPIGGVRRIFSVQGIVSVSKAILKLGLILPIGYFGLKRFAPDMLQLVHMSVQQILDFMGHAIVDLFWKIMYVLISLAIFDLLWTRYRWLRQNKMTKDEVKDERKSIEGDEQTKRKMQAKGLQRIMQRIRDSVPQADVVITNPTHYAVALKYDREHMSAPVVVAKGKGFLALRIRAIAKEARVPILERKPLARALFRSTEVGSQIPYELFKAVAEVLAYVYRLKNPHRHAQRRGMS